MDVRLLYFEDCPSWRLADARLHEALARIGDPTTDVTYQLVRTPEEAERAAFRGSPTIMVNGHDPFARPNDPIGLACRLYRTADGEQHSPTVDDLHSALRRPGTKRSTAMPRRLRRSGTRGRPRRRT